MGRNVLNAPSVRPFLGDRSRSGGRGGRCSSSRWTQRTLVGGPLPALIELAGDPDRVLTVSDFAAAAGLGVRIAQIGLRFDLLGEFARLAGEGSWSYRSPAPTPSTRSRRRPSSASPAGRAASSCSSCDRLPAWPDRVRPAGGQAPVCRQSWTRTGTGLLGGLYNWEEHASGQAGQRRVRHLRLGVAPVATPSYRWRLGDGRAAGSPGFPDIVGGSSQVLLTVPDMILPSGGRWPAGVEEARGGGVEESTELLQGGDLRHSVATSALASASRSAQPPRYRTICTSAHSSALRTRTPIESGSATRARSVSNG